MTDPIEIYSKLTQHRFWAKAHPVKNNPKLNKLNEQAALIISGCQELLSLTNDKYAKERLRLILQHSQELLQLAQQQAVEKRPEISEQIVAKYQQLQIQELSLPSIIQTPKNLSDTNYKVALTCFYIILLSVALAVGATFGAWYFGFLAAGYFTDVLVMALSAIGIPALCVGLFSYGAYQAQKNPVANKLDALKNNIEALYDGLEAFEIEEKTDEDEEPTQLIL